MLTMKLGTDANANANANTNDLVASQVALQKKSQVQALSYQ
ncbi:predicted protein [Plenodomus lingam JN3]|uniref:Predicted protein n=1 Tax=Leptosphaeria maculans (strain JN3 / isolate v23.1.3 / race Av1-4-5-6-7-8) TaxID=985895 RepID=E5ADS8_LEPMJ|nr:predicted protein [Plenodomus lingam JN3]CBY01367.1 predicted protein [Plenodomus lingam JN3]